jgi:hypothetical protein
MGLFALRFFARGIAALGTAALLLCVTFPSSIGVNVSDFTKDPNISYFVNAVMDQLPDLDKMGQNALQGSNGDHVDPSPYLNVQNTFQDIVSKLKNASVAP